MPRIESVFVDFGVPLPATARIVLAVAHLAFRLAPIVPVLLAVWLVTDWYVLKRLGERGEARSAHAWAVLVLMTPLALLVLIAWALGQVFFILNPRLCAAGFPGTRRERRSAHLSPRERSLRAAGG